MQHIDDHDEDSTHHSAEKHAGEDNSSPHTKKQADNVVNFADLRRRDKAPTQQDHKQKHPPMINLPSVTKWLALSNIAIFAFMLLPFAPSTGEIFVYFGFIPARYTVGLNGIDTGFLSYLISPLSHMFIHSGWLHICMNIFMLMAFAAGVEKAFGGLRMLAFYIGCGLIGAFTHFAIDPASTVPMVGASGALSGLFSAILVILQKNGGLPRSKYGLWPFIILWIGISVLFAALNNFNAGSIAWAAHIGGFLGGFALLRLKYFRI